MSYLEVTLTELNGITYARKIGKPLEPSRLGLQLYSRPWQFAAEYPGTIQLQEKRMSIPSPPSGAQSLWGVSHPCQARHFPLLTVPYLSSVGTAVSFSCVLNSFSGSFQLDRNIGKLA